MKLWQIEINFSDIWTSCNETITKVHSHAESKTDSTNSVWHWIFSKQHCMEVNNLLFNAQSLKKLGNIGKRSICCERFTYLLLSRFSQGQPRAIYPTMIWFRFLVNLYSKLKFMGLALWILLTTSLVNKKVFQMVPETTQCKITNYLSS